MMRTGYIYRVQTDRFGNALITRLKDRASVYLQGDDAVEIESQLDALEATAEKGYPVGPFADYASHLDAVLDTYSTVMSGESDLERARR
jgi:hypothetical protein